MVPKDDFCKVDKGPFLLPGILLTEFHMISAVIVPQRKATHEYVFACLSRASYRVRWVMNMGVVCSMI